MRRDADGSSTIHIGAVRQVPSPARTLYRLGRGPDPLAWPPWEVIGRNRFDDPLGRFRVLYVAERRRCCFAEALAPFRPELPAIGAPLGALPAPRALPHGWLASRSGGRLRLALGQRWLDLRAIETREALRVRFASLVLGVGMADLDGAAVRSAERRLTRAIAGWAYDQGYQGIAYTSRLDDRWSCWAIFEGVGGHSSGLPEAHRRLRSGPGGHRGAIPPRPVIWAYSTMSMRVDTCGDGHS